MRTFFEHQPLLEALRRSHWSHCVAFSTGTTTRPSLLHGARRASSGLYWWLCLDCIFNRALGERLKAY